MRNVNKESSCFDSSSGLGVGDWNVYPQRRSEFNGRQLSLRISHSHSECECDFEHIGREVDRLFDVQSFTNRTLQTFQRSRPTGFLILPTAPTPAPLPQNSILINHSLKTSALACIHASISGVMYIDSISMGLCRRMVRTTLICSSASAKWSRIEPDEPTMGEDAVGVAPGESVVERTVSIWIR